MADDHSRGSLLCGGAEGWVSGLRFLRTETHARLATRLVATVGDRLARSRSCWQATPGESSFLIERFGLYEIDAAGKLRAFVVFDADDGAAAHAELFERYVAGGADGTPRGIYVALGRYHGDQVAAYAFFEPEHLGAALARFEALGAEPARA